jgi:3-hydroxyisobutyrate dehydrogenase
MGAGMARSLARAGHHVTVWNRTADKADAIAGGEITASESVTDAVTGADAVITMLFDLDATLSIADDIVAALGPDSVWIQSGTVGPGGARRIAEVGTGGMLDAPVLGTKQPAEEGKLVVLVSGPDALIEAAKPVFDAIGSRTVVAGSEIGMASGLKLACNAWIGVLTAGTAQSLAFASAVGVDPALFLQAIEGQAADSPYAQTKGKAILGGKYGPSFALDGLVKDLGLMVDIASTTQFPDELIAAVRELFARASDAGHGAEDIAAVRFAFPQ